MRRTGWIWGGWESGSAGNLLGRSSHPAMLLSGSASPPTRRSALHSPNAISDRTTRFLEAVIQADAERVQDNLSRQHIAIRLAPHDPGGFTGQAILFTLLNLLV